MAIPNKNYTVVDADGQRFYIEKEPLEGILKWAEGQDVTIFEYTFTGVVYRDKKAVPR